VLDLGCYKGHESKKYLEYGASYVCGIDISDEAISYARESISAGVVKQNTMRRWLSILAAGWFL
jgi:cyclopropane fatty-acyl-phospholipid synthase-like methyltransferase